jgi:hypothetical protein
MDSMALNFIFRQRIKREWASMSLFDQIFNPPHPNPNPPPAPKTHGKFEKTGNVSKQLYA